MTHPAHHRSNAAHGNLGVWLVPRSRDLRSRERGDGNKDGQLRKRGAVYSRGSVVGGAANPQIRQQICLIYTCACGSVPESGGSESDRSSGGMRRKRTDVRLNSSERHQTLPPSHPCFITDAQTGKSLMQLLRLARRRSEAPRRRGRKERRGFGKFSLNPDCAEGFCSTPATERK